MSSEIKKKKEILQSLLGMGFPKQYCYKAIAAVDVSKANAIDRCLQWIHENPEVQANKESTKYRETLVPPLTKMGFSREEAEKGLTAARNDMHRAIVWILADKTKNLKRAIEDEQVALAGFGVDTDINLPDDADEPLRLSFSSAPASDPKVQAQELKVLTKQIVALQNLVLHYQDQYLALKTQVSALSPQRPGKKPRAKASRKSSAEADVKALVGSVAGRPRKKMEEKIDDNIPAPAPTGAPGASVPKKIKKVRKKSISKSSGAEKEKKTKKKSAKKAEPWESIGMEEANGNSSSSREPGAPEPEPGAPAAEPGTEEHPPPPSPPKPRHRREPSDAPPPPPAEEDDEDSFETDNSDTFQEYDPQAFEDAAQVPEQIKTGHGRKNSTGSIGSAPPPPEESPESPLELESKVAPIARRATVDSIPDVEAQARRIAMGGSLASSKANHVRTPSQDWRRQARANSDDEDDAYEDDSSDDEVLVASAGGAPKVGALKTKAPETRFNRTLSHASGSKQFGKQDLKTLDELKKMTAATKKLSLNDMKRPGMLSLLKEEKAKPKVTRGWVNDVGYKSLSVNVKGVLELAAKLGKSFYCIARVDSQAYKSPMIPVTALEDDTWTEHFEFDLLSTTQHISVSVFDGDDDSGYVGRAALTLEDIEKPNHDDWHRLSDIQVSKFAKLRSRASRPSEIHLRVSCSLEMAHPGTRYLALSEEKNTNSIADALRGISSGLVWRYQSHGFDLDLSYINDRVIAMSQPEKGIALTSNKMEEVQRFFKKQHVNRYKIYNLSPGKQYDASKFQGSVVFKPLREDTPLHYTQILPLITDMHMWLKHHPQNVIAVHAKNGKERTGFIIACYLVYSRLVSGADAAIKIFNKRRAKDGRGLTIPSLLRYVSYFERACAAAEHPGRDELERQIHASKPVTLQVISVCIIEPPSALMDGKPIISFKSMDKSFKWSSKNGVDATKTVNAHMNSLEFNIMGSKSAPPSISGDILVKFSVGSMLSQTDVMQFWFNSRFVGDGTDKIYSMQIPRAGVDGAQDDAKGKLLPAKMLIKFQFKRV